MRVVRRRNGLGHPLRGGAVFAIIPDRSRFGVWFTGHRRPEVRDTLVTALVSCTDNPLQPRARQFLAGLSCDELQFIAEFVGAYILEPARQAFCSRAQLAECIAYFQQSRGWNCPLASEDRDHKMILLLEFLCRSGLGSFRGRASGSRDFATA